MGAPKRPLAAAGDILAIPYNGEAAVYGRVIQNDTPATPEKAKHGVYMKVLDREVAAGDDLGEITRSRILLGPLQVTPELVKNGTWRIVGNVPLTADEQRLPYFGDGRGIVNYFNERVPDTAENQARVIDERVGPPELVPQIVRAARGIEPWYPGYDAFKPREES